MSDARGKSWRSEAALAFVILVWGVNFPVVKAVLDVMHPHVLNSFRFVCSAGALGGLYAYRQHRDGKPLFEPLREYWKQIAGLGILGFVLYQFCFIVGLDHTTAGNAALIMASSPLWTALVGYFLRLEQLSRGAWLALAIVLVGAAVVVVGGGQEVRLGSDTLFGNLIMIGAALFWGSYTALSKPILRSVTPSGLVFLSLLFALPFLFGIGIPYFDEVTWSDVRPLHWAAILFSGALSTGLTIAIWNHAIDKVGASNTAVHGNLVPLVALMSSYLLIGEQIFAGQIVGGALVIGGLLLMRRTRPTPHAVQ